MININNNIKSNKMKNKESKMEVRENRDNKDASLNAKQFRSLLDDLSASELKAVLQQLETKLDTIYFNKSQILMNVDELLNYYDDIVFNSQVYYTFYISLNGASINLKEIRGASKARFQERKTAEREVTKQLHQMEVINAIQLNWFQRLIYVFNSRYIFKVISNNIKNNI
jgi:hypothetical protein